MFNSGAELSTRDAQRCSCAPQRCAQLNAHRGTQRHRGAQRDEGTGMENPKATPEYRRVADGLREQISAGRHPVGAMLPSLPQIEAEFGVSMTVARRALMELRLEGLISTQHGVGSKVLAAPRSDGTPSPEYEAIMRVVGKLQEQIDELADQVDGLRRHQGREPQRSTGRVGRTSPPVEP